MIKQKEEVEIEELYKDYPGKGWVLGTKDEPPKPKPKDIVWRSKVHHWDQDVRSSNTRLIIVDTKKSGKDRFQMWAASDKSGKIVFHFGDKPTFDAAKEFASIRKWQQKKEEVEIDEKWEEMFGDETYQDSAWFDPADIRTKVQQARAKLKPHDEDEEELAHRLHQQRTNESKKTYKEFVKEQTGSTAVFTFGRFNPPTIGHEKLLKVVENTASSEKGDYFIFMNHSQDIKENPLSYNQKLTFMKMMFPEHRMAFTKSKAEHALELMTQIYEMHGYSKVVMVVGDDRVEEFDQILNKNSGEKGKHGFYRFEDINVVSAGETDPDADGAEGMSAFKMRAAVAEGKYDVFKMGVPTGVSEKDCHNLYNAIAKGMKIQLKEVWGIDEDELDEKPLSPAQRRKMGLRMRIMAKKPSFIMKRQRAMKRAATKKKLLHRARKSAIKKVIKKFYPKLRTMKTSDLSYAERGKISAIVKKKSKLIARLARRMVKDKRKQDIERRKSMQSKPRDDTPKKSKEMLKKATAIKGG